MQRAQLRDLAVRRSGRHGKPFDGVRQVNGLFEIKLGVVAESSGFLSSPVAVAQNGKLAPMQLRGSLAGAIGHPDMEMRRVIVIEHQNQRKAWMDVIREMAAEEIRDAGHLLFAASLFPFFREVFHP